jgi:hypothetical protein
VTDDIAATKATLLAALEASERSRAQAMRLVDSVTASRSAWCDAAREEGRASMRREVDALRETNERLTADIEARDAELARLRRVEGAARACRVEHSDLCWEADPAPCTCGLASLRAALDGSGSDVG